jgi:drug/metabolite transporter (DMT)-like permease
MFLKIVSYDYPPLKKSALMITGACILIFICLPPTFLINGTLGTSLLKWGIILALFGTIIPPMLMNAGFPLTGIGLGSIVSALELPVSVMMAFVLLNEDVKPIQWFGIILIIIAIIIMLLNPNT